MNNDQIIQLLHDYKSYKYALRNVGAYDTGLSLIAVERIRTPNSWDGTRYSRIVEMIDGAVNELLTDGQRMVVMRLYIDRNNPSMNSIALMECRDRGTISRWHKEALRRLRVALEPLSYDDREIHNLDYWLNNKTS